MAALPLVFAAPKRARPPTHLADPDEAPRPAARAAARSQIAGGTGRLSNVVFMGMGEPLANYSRLLAALRRLIDPAPAGLGLSRRSITVSTVGLVPAIGRLADANLDVTLAVSL